MFQECSSARSGSRGSERAAASVYLGMDYRSLVYRVVNSLFFSLSRHRKTNRRLDCSRLAEGDRGKKKRERKKRNRIRGQKGRGKDRNAKWSVWRARPTTSEGHFCRPSAICSRRPSVLLSSLEIRQCLTRAVPSHLVSSCLVSPVNMREILVRCMEVAVVYLTQRHLNGRGSIQSLLSSGGSKC